MVYLYRGKSMNLEEKLIKSNEQIDRILNEDVEIKIVCIIDNKILLHNETMLLPKFIIKKSSLLDEEIINNINEILNTEINKVISIPFDIYNNYNERYYLINIDYEELFNINKEYEFYNINDMNNINEKDVIIRL